MTENVEAVQKKAYFPALTGLRFIAILIIVYYHGSHLFGSNNPGRLELFFRNWGGTLGNQIFFTLSGFLLAYTYKEKIINSILSFSKFIKKRLVSIYPVYFLGIVSGILFCFLCNGFADIKFTNIFLNLTMLSTGWIGNIYRFNSPLWFFCIILQCYILFYFFCYLSRKNKNVSTYCFFAAALLGYIFWMSPHELPFINYWSAQGIHSFFIGCLVFELFSHSTIKNIRIITGIGCTLCLLFIILSFFVGFEPATGGILFITLCIAPVSILACTQSKFLNVILGLGPLKWGGELSLSIVTLHMTLLDVCNFVLYQRGLFFNDSSPLVRAAVYVLLLFPICFFCHILFEKKITKYLKNKL